MQQKEPVYALMDHLFRHESGKMVAVLTRIFGIAHLDIVEDIVQETMLTALSAWRMKPLPKNPQAWLYTVAKNKALDVVRRKNTFKQVSKEHTYLLSHQSNAGELMDELFLEHEIKDNVLRMMFACCHPSLSEEAQVTFILKTLCGLSVQEIANAFLTGKDTIEKRLYRTKEKIIAQQISFDIPGELTLTQRLESIHKALYLLFNEGYNSSHPQTLIRKDLCLEAMRLCLLLTEIPYTNLPSTKALLALMCFQASRFDARIDHHGLIVLLPEQNRTLWNEELIKQGVYYLSASAQGNAVTRYHFEAAIASCYATVPDFESINWEYILRLYNGLLAIFPAPIVILNRAIVQAKLGSVEMALKGLLAEGYLGNHYLYQATIGDFYKQLHNPAKAKESYLKALELTSSLTEKELLQWKIESLYLEQIC